MFFFFSVAAIVLASFLCIYFFCWVSIPCLLLYYYYIIIPQQQPIHLYIANSILAAIQLIKDGPKPKQIILISIVISKQGLALLQEEHSDLIIHAASVSDEVNADGALVPGLGDVGDRLFGTGVTHHAAASPKNPDFYSQPNSPMKKNTGPPPAKRQKK